MNKKFKFLTVLLALVMTLGAFAPFSARAEEERTETVTLHKVLMDKSDLNVKVWTGDYNGQKDVRVVISKTTVNGNDVYKELTKNNLDSNVLKDLYTKGSELFPGEIGIDGTIYDGNEIKNMQAYFGDSQKPAKGVYFVVKNADGSKFIKEDGTETADESQALKGFTDETGKVVFNTVNLVGNYQIVEDRTKSKYDKEDAELLSGSKAVPVVITLPLVNEEGVVKHAHVYPKNTKDKPEIDKNFKKDHFKDTDAYEDTNKNIKDGAKYENSGKDKATAKVNVGDVVPFEVKTKIPKDAKYKNLVWTDEMTKGLTYNKGSLTVDGAGLTTDDYILIETYKGFTLNIKETGLTKIENAAKTADIEITLNYTATVNKSAEPDVVDKNNVKLDYSNKPGKHSEPKEGNPVNKQITVNKTWSVDGKESNAPSGVRVVYTLQVQDGDKWQDVESVEKTGTDFSHTFTGLDDNKTYRVVETVSGYDPEYKSFEGGVVTINNNTDSDNPKPLEPTDPKVITGGKKFVKTNQDKSERLAGAEFYVKNAEGKYLVHSSIVEVEKEKKELDDAKDARDKAYEEYNKMTKADQEGEAGKKKKEEMKTLQEKYEELLNKYSDSYTWGSKDDKHVVILTSNKDGQFEITGLKYGTYYLEEKTAPEGYAKLNAPVEFTVANGSYANGIKDPIDYVKESGKNDAQCIANKKVSIPQTGGIGTVIFTVVGVMLMVGAAFALKRRKEDELEGLA